MLTPVRSALPALLLFGAAAGTAAALAPDDPPAATAQAAQLEDAFATVAERVSPAVVSLRVEAEAPAGAPSPLQRFFGGGAAPPAIRRGGGSGFLIRPDGHILTNAHVVDGARRIEARLRDGRRFPGRVVGVDPDTDLAVVKIDASGLPTLELAESEAVRPGQWSLAVGSPFGLDYTVTAGVVSAVGRGIGANPVEDFVQTDASINPGNSGGPLVDLRGRVIGVNTMILGRGTGIGFAVASDLAGRVAEQLIEDGRVRRAWLGVSFQELSPGLAGRLGLDAARGALVSAVVPEGGAARAGLRPGDVIVSVDERAVEDGRDLLRAVLAQDVGARVRLGVVRDGQRRELEATLGERPSERVAARERAEPGAAGGAWGLSLAPLDRAERQALGEGGVKVAAVRPGSPAERAGLRPGDVLVEADRQALTDPGVLEEALEDGSALLRVRRERGAFFAVLERG